VEVAGSAGDAKVSGTQIVESGGTAFGAFVISGGVQVVENGGIALGTVLDGGLMEVVGGGSVGPPPKFIAAVTFTSAGGDLQLDASQSFQVQGLIAGFASPAGVTEEIDLRDIAFGPNTRAAFIEAATGSSGTLTVTDGTHTADLTLLGQYATANFSLSSDGAGGTFVKDPALVGSAASPVLAAHA